MFVAIALIVGVFIADAVTFTEKEAWTTLHKFIGQHQYDVEQVYLIDHKVITGLDFNTMDGLSNMRVNKLPEDLIGQEVYQFSFLGDNVIGEGKRKGTLLVVRNRVIGGSSYILRPASYNEKGIVGYDPGLEIPGTGGSKSQFIDFQLTWEAQVREIN